MTPPLRARLLLAFAILAGAMAAVTVMAVWSLRTQSDASLALLARQQAGQAALAEMESLAHRAQTLLRAHVAAQGAAERQDFAHDLLSLEVREGLALAALADLAEGPQVLVLQDLTAAQADEVALRAEVLAISDRASLQVAALLATQEMPGLRAELISLLRAVAVQGGAEASLPAARAEGALNALAAAQKNAILNPEHGYVTGQLTAATLAQAELTAALTLLEATGAPALAPLRAAMVDLAALDARLAALLSDPGRDRLHQMLTVDLVAAQDRRLAALDTLGSLFATAWRAQAAQRSTGQVWLVGLADLALILGGVLVVLALRNIGRGMEGAVKLAERMAEGESAAPAWTGHSLSGRLTSALVRISAGQTAVAAGIDAVRLGQKLRHDLPRPILLRLEALQAAQGGDRAMLPDQAAEAARALRALRRTLAAARAEGAALGDQAERALAGVEGDDFAQLTDAERVETLSETLTSQSLHLQRQAATLAQAEYQAQGLEQALSARPNPATAAESDGSAPSGAMRLIA